MQIFWARFSKWIWWSVLWFFVLQQPYVLLPYENVFSDLYEQRRIFDTTFNVVESLLREFRFLGKGSNLQMLYDLVNIVFMLLCLKILHILSIIPLTLGKKSFVVVVINNFYLGVNVLFIFSLLYPLFCNVFRWKLILLLNIDCHINSWRK